MESKSFKVLISDGLNPEGIEILKNHQGVMVDTRSKLTGEELLELIEPYDAIIIRSATKITKQVLEKAKHLKVIARAGTGYDNVDLEECTKRGVVVLITPTGNSNAVAELTMAMILAYARRIPKANRTMSEGKWEKKALEGTELRGKTVGILGLGRIGSSVAKRCKAFEMQVLAYDQFVPKKVADDLNIILVNNLEDILTQADYLTIHLPLTEKTQNLIDTPQLAKMKKTAVIVNVARGGIVNEQALYTALKEKQIGGACMDVYSKEPTNPKDTPFIGLDNVITTPHIGASTEEAQIEVSKMAANAIIQALHSGVYIDAVNMPFQISAAMADAYRPFMLLGTALGRLVSQYNPGRISSVEIRYQGSIFTNFEPIKNTILHAIFSERFAENVTIMNILKVVKDLGITVESGEYYKKVNYQAFIKVYIVTEKGETKAAGTVFNDHPKISEINGIYFDLPPSEYMIILVNNDRPGVIGRVGTLLGDNHINIAEWQLGRQTKGQTAMAVITVDDPIPPAVMDQLKKLPEIIDAKSINL
jgi:D-3-phosphoglycerate dehydrogenase